MVLSGRRQGTLHVYVRCSMSDVRSAERQTNPLAAVAGASAGVQFAACGYRDNAGVGAGALLVVGKTVDGIDAIGAIGEQLLEPFDVLSAAG